MDAADDDGLMAQVRSGDRAAFECLVHRHLDSVHRYLVRLTPSPADADELAQETFLRLWQRASSYRPGQVRLTTWLHRIAHNLAVDRFRRRHGEHTGLAEPEALAELDGAVTPDEQLALTRTGRLLDRAIAALPANQRAALILCQVQGFSNRETAGILGLSVRGVESLIARARRSLRRTLEAADGAAPGAGSEDHESS